MSQNVDRVIEVISKDTGSRQDYEIEAIAPWLRKRSQLLQGVEKAVLYDILRNCYHQRSQKDDVIIRQCEIGETFYIILRGTVSVYIDSQMSGEDSIPTVGAPVKGVEIDRQSKRRKAPAKPQSPVKNISGAHRAKFGKFIVKFEPGKSFGEIALLTKGSIRNASIIVDEETDFLVVHRDLFNRCLKEHEEREFAAIRDFVDTHPFFGQWQRRLKRFLEMSVRKEVYEYNSVIVKQGEPVTALYFIYRGQAKVLIDPTKHKNQYRRLWPFEAVSDLYAQEFEWLREARKQAIAKKYSQDPTVLQTKNENLLVRRSEGYAAAEKLIHGRTITLCTVNNMEVIGDAEVISKLDTYMQTVVCTSGTQVYILDMKNYERLVLKKNPATLQVIKDIVSDKLFGRMSSHQGKQIPLLKYLHFKLNEENYQSSKELPPLKTTKTLPDSELLQKYLVKAFVEGKSQICEPHVPGMTYYRELMQDKARIRENIRTNQGIKRHREKLYSEKLKNRKPRSSAALKDALNLMEEDDMVAWREQIGKDFLEMIVPPSKNISKGKETSHTGKGLQNYKGEKKPQNLTFHFASQENAKAGSQSPTSVEIPADEPNVTSVLNKPLPPEMNQNENEPISATNCEELNQRGENSEILEQKEMQAETNPDTEFSEKTEGQDADDPKARQSKSKQNKTVMVTHLTTIREESYIHPEPDESLVEHRSETEQTEATLSTEPVLHKEKRGEETTATDEQVMVRAEDEHDEVTTRAVSPQETNENFGARRPAPDVNGETPVEENVSAGARAWSLTRQFVQQKIERKKQESTLFDDRYTEYKDYETSERTLTFLENRLKAFHLKYSTSRRPIKLPKLRRFRVEQDELYKSMRKGGRVRIKRRACELSQTEYKIKDHQHVHYHMVPKIVEVQDMRKTRMVMQFIVDNPARRETGDMFVIPTGNNSDR
ncbi:uncharacterized protein LOC135477869 [Liolophura sinensis]|uniref:uncharacterized protein LOC135477869 n=1 Tax=Liolophura sinensis TaxID=3198878 RepID=UPI0031583378